MRVQSYTNYTMQDFWKQVAFLCEVFNMYATLEGLAPPPRGLQMFSSL
jgi:hypothetical protein